MYPDKTIINFKQNPRLKEKKKNLQGSRGKIVIWKEKKILLTRLMSNHIGSKKSVDQHLKEILQNKVRINFIST